LKGVVFFCMFWVVLAMNAEKNIAEQPLNSVLEQHPELAALTAPTGEPQTGLVADPLLLSLISSAPIQEKYPNGISELGSPLSD
jgi:hypothetical protein